MSRLRDASLFGVMLCCLSSASILGNDQSDGRGTCELGHAGVCRDDESALDDEHDSEDEDDLSSLLQLTAGCFSATREDEKDDLESLLQVGNAPQVLPRSKKQQLKTQRQAAEQALREIIPTKNSSQNNSSKNDSQGNSFKNSSRSNSSDEAWAPLRVQKTAFENADEQPITLENAEEQARQWGDEALMDAMGAAETFLNAAQVAQNNVAQVAEKLKAAEAAKHKAAGQELNQPIKDLLQADEIGGPIGFDEHRGMSSQMSRVRDVVAWFSISVTLVMIAFATLSAKDKFHTVENEEKQVDFIHTAHLNEAS